MNMKRLLIAIVAGFVFIFATDFVIHGVWLNPDYEATKELWRTEADMQSRFAWMLIAQLLCALTFTVVWAMGFAGRDMSTAVTFGVLMGLFQQVWVMINYVVVPMPGSIAVKWFVAGMVQAIGLALLVAALYKPANVSNSTLV